MTAPAFTFGPHPGIDDACEIEVDGFTVRVRIEHDPDYGEPWKEHDGHGPVSEWTTRPKLAGEFVLAQEGFTGGQRRYYDFAAACRIARADGWGCQSPEGLTARQQAAMAAAEDFARLKAWCDDEWIWAGVVLEVERAGVILGHASLWGIESDAGDYFNQVAAELLTEALVAARAKLIELVT